MALINSSSGNRLAYINNIGVSVVSGGGGGGPFVQSVKAIDPLFSTEGLNPVISLTGIVSPAHGGTGIDLTDPQYVLNPGWFLTNKGDGTWELIAPPEFNTILSGNGLPAGSLGAIGDFYLDLDTFILYGPKLVANQWPTTGTSIVGPAGPRGNSVLNGIIDPDSSIGEGGDFYINTVTEQIFGPKVGGVWGSGTDLKGPQGDAGLTPSENWVYGNDYYPGNVVTSGGSAWLCVTEDAPSTIDPATLTNPHWILFLSVGQVGPTGPTGLSVLSGPSAPLPTDGRTGEFWLETTDTKLYGPKDVSTGWSKVVDLKGQNGNRFIPVAFNRYSYVDIDTVISDFAVSDTDAPNGFNVLTTGFAPSGVTMHVSLYNITDSILVDEGDIASPSPTTLTLTAPTPSGSKHYELRIKRVGGTTDNLVVVEIAYRELL